jgi:hypothetical protein
MVIVQNTYRQGAADRVTLSSMHCRIKERSVTSFVEKIFQPPGERDVRSRLLPRRCAHDRLVRSSNRNSDQPGYFGNGHGAVSNAVMKSASEN